jgi:hypothetical protein
VQNINHMFRLKLSLHVVNRFCVLSVFMLHFVFTFNCIYNLFVTPNLLVCLVLYNISVPDEVLFLRFIFKYCF